MATDEVDKIAEPRPPKLVAQITRSGIVLVHLKPGALHSGSGS